MAETLILRDLQVELKRTLTTEALLTVLENKLRPDP